MHLPGHGVAGLDHLFELAQGVVPQYIMDILGKQPPECPPGYPARQTLSPGIVKHQVDREQAISCRQFLYFKAEEPAVGKTTLSALWICMSPNVVIVQSLYS